MVALYSGTEVGSPRATKEIPRELCTVYLLISCLELSAVYSILVESLMSKRAMTEAKTDLEVVALQY